LDLFQKKSTVLNLITSLEKWYDAIYENSNVDIVAHVFNTISKRTLSPYKEQLPFYEETELLLLNELKDIIDNCNYVCNVIRDTKLVLELPRKPVMGVKTRWLTYLFTCRDTLEFLGIIN